jgi:hypothetical protein
MAAYADLRMSYDRPPGWHGPETEFVTLWERALAVPWLVSPVDGMRLDERLFSDVLAFRHQTEMLQALRDLVQEYGF